MKNVKSLILMLLIPIATVFMGCENEIPEEFIIEINEDNPPDQELVNQIDYFKLTLFEADLADNAGPIDYILEDERLYRGEILRLENLKPGKYTLWVSAYKIGEEDDIQEILVYPESNKMDDYGNIIIDDESPTIVKIVISGQA